MPGSERSPTRGRAPRRAAGALLALALAAPAPARAGDAAKGRARAGACAVCHGDLGMSAMAGVPNLAGQPEVYLVEQLKAYRSGKRVHEVMNVAAKGLANAEIDDLAAWYASIAVRAEAPKR